MKVLIRLWSVAFIGIFLLSCSNNDGSLGLDSSLINETGQGTYKVALLDSGDRIHAIDQPLWVYIDSLWLVSRCYLTGINNSYNVNGAMLDWKLVFPLRGSSELQCPASPKSTDTLLQWDVQNQWANMDLLRIWDSENAKILDSIWLRSGKNSDTIWSFALDTFFNDPYAMPLRYKAMNNANDNGPYILRGVRSFKADTSWWWYVSEKCTNPRSQCALENDTLWPNQYYPADTISISIRKRCMGDSTALEYCASANWVVDSSIAFVIDNKPDTLWNLGTFYLENIPQCATVNNENSKLSVPYYNTSLKRFFWRKLFVQNDNESRCGIPWNGKQAQGTLLESWYAYDLDSLQVVTDLLLLDTLIQRWK